MREHNALRFRSALQLQLAWYKYKGAFATFLLLSCLRELDKQENDFKAEINRR